MRSGQTLTAHRLSSSIAALVPAAGPSVPMRSYECEFRRQKGGRVVQGHAATTEMRGHVLVRRLRGTASNNHELQANLNPVDCAVACFDGFGKSAHTLVSMLEDSSALVTQAGVAHGDLGSMSGCNWFGVVSRESKYCESKYFDCVAPITSAAIQSGLSRTIRLL